MPNDDGEAGVDELPAPDDGTDETGGRPGTVSVDREAVEAVRDRGQESDAAAAPSDEPRLSAGLDLRAALVRSAGYALVAATVALVIHATGTLRGLGHPRLPVALAVDAGRAAGTFSVAYPVILAANTVGRRLGVTRRIAARSAVAPPLLYVATTAAVTVALFLPVIRAVVAGTPY